MLPQHLKKKKKLTDCLEHDASSFLYENQSYKKVSSKISWNSEMNLGNVYICSNDDLKSQEDNLSNSFHYNVYNFYNQGNLWRSEVHIRTQFLSRPKRILFSTTLSEQRFIVVCDELNDLKLK